MKTHCSGVLVQTMSARPDGMAKVPTLLPNQSSKRLMKGINTKLQCDLTGIIFCKGPYLINLPGKESGSIPGGRHHRFGEYSFA